MIRKATDKGGQDLLKQRYRRAPCLLHSGQYHPAFPTNGAPSAAIWQKPLQIGLFLHTFSRQICYNTSYIPHKATTERGVTMVTNSGSKPKDATLSVHPLQLILARKRDACKASVDHYNKKIEDLKPAPTTHEKHLQRTYQMAAQDYDLQRQVLDQVLTEWERANA